MHDSEYLGSANLPIKVRPDVSRELFDLDRAADLHGRLGRHGLVSGEEGRYRQGCGCGCGSRAGK